MIHTCYHDLKDVLRRAKVETILLENKLKKIVIFLQSILNRCYSLYFKVPISPDKKKDNMENCPLRPLVEIQVPDHALWLSNSKPRLRE